MPDFHQLASPILSPTKCVTCSTQHDHEGFVDLGVELFPYGRLYLCAHCAWQAGTASGCADPTQVARSNERISALTRERDQLDAALAAEQGKSRLVPLDELKVILGRDGTRTTSVGKTKIASKAA